MGRMRHHAIVVTGWKDEAVAAAHDQAEALLYAATDPGSPAASVLLTPIMRALTNGYSSFAILPDGSKEWWDTSNAVEDARAEFLRWLREADGYLKWVEVQFGDDDGDTRITAHCDDDGGDPYAPASDEGTERG